MPEITVKRLLFTQMFELRKERVRQVTAYFFDWFIVIFCLCYFYDRSFSFFSNSFVIDFTFLDGFLNTSDTVEL